MKIAVVGTGNVGRTLGVRWAAAGYDVVFGSRRAGSELEELDGIPVQLPQPAAQGADIVVLATPWSATRSTIRSLGDLKGKILVDCTNPLGEGFRFEAGPGNSGGEQVSRWAEGARVVKALNTTGARNMGDPVLEGMKLVMFICGDDATAKEPVMQMVAALGFEPVDNGPLSHALYLESFAMLWITQAYQAGWGPDFGFSVVRRLD